MDLRQYIHSDEQLQQGVSLIRSNDLFYQPFILAEDVEVGEGQNFVNRYDGVQSVFDSNVYAPEAAVGGRIQAKDKEFFRKCNHEYRSIYEFIADEIASRCGGHIGNLSFAEIGCNTGLNLFNLAKRGANACIGYDWNEMSGVFAWLNRVLGKQVRFQKATYNNLFHRLEPLDAQEVDVMINTIFTNHQCDPLQFLSYICDRARRGVFLWVLVDDDGTCSLHYPRSAPHVILGSERPFPAYFNNDVHISHELLLLSLRQLGFADVERLPKYVPSDNWNYFQNGFVMYYARRTSEAKSAYWPFRDWRLTPPDARIEQIRTVDLARALYGRLRYKAIQR